jgi:HEAT repeat protein
VIAVRRCQRTWPVRAAVAAAGVAGLVAVALSLLAPRGGPVAVAPSGGADWSGARDLVQSRRSRSDSWTIEGSRSVIQYVAGHTDALLAAARSREGDGWQWAALVLGCYPCTDANDALVELVRTGTSEQRVMALRCLQYTARFDQRALDAARAALQDPDATVREWAICTLAWSGASEDSADVVSLMADRDPAIRQAACDGAVVTAGSRAGLVRQRLLPLLSDADDGVRRTAVLGLAFLGDARARTEARAMAGSTDPLLSAAGCMALVDLRGGYGPVEPELVAWLRAGLQSRFARVRGQAAQACARLGPDSYPLAADLRMVLESGGLGFAESAVALGQCGDLTAREAVIGLAESDDPAVQRGAVLALGVLPDVDGRSIDVLTPLLKGGSPAVRGNAALSVARLGGTADSQAVPGLLELLSDDSPWACLQAARALAMLGRLEGLPRAVGFLEDASPATRCLALAVVRDCGHAARPYRRTLRRCLRDPDADVRVGAAVALAMAGDGAGRPLLTSPSASVDDAGRVWAAAGLTVLGDADSERRLRSMVADEAPAARWAAMEALPAVERSRH